MALFSLFVLTLGEGPANAAPPGSCPLSITSCGCTITKANTYTVANDLAASQTAASNCIEIAASFTILNLKGNAIVGNGDGTGIGILIQKNASHVVVEGGDEGNATPPDDAGTNGDDFPSAQGVVTQWNIGIEDDGDGAVIQLFKNLGGNIFQQNFGNATAGVLIKQAKNSSLNDFHASYNGRAGVILSNATGTRVSNFSAIGNAQSGIWLENSNDNTIGTASAAGNGLYGIWLLNSSSNTIIDCNGTSGNGDTGILLGCGTTVKCTGSMSSNENRITNSGAPGNTLNGILLEKKNGSNIISVTHNDGNPQNHDMVDQNSNCDSNIWYNNAGTTSQNCIH